MTRYALVRESKVTRQTRAMGALASTVMVALTFLLPLGGRASASGREQGSVLPEGVSSSVGRVIARPGQGGAAASDLARAALAGAKPKWVVSANFDLRGDGGPYQGWNAGVAVSSQGASFAIGGYRSDDRSWTSQGYSWYTDLPRSDVHMSRNMRSVTIDADLGVQGSIDLRLTAKGRIATRTWRCRTTGKKLWTSHSAAHAEESGTFSFTPGLSGLPTTVDTLGRRAQFYRKERTGNTCPSQHGEHCYASSSFSAGQGRHNFIFAARNFLEFDRFVGDRRSGSWWSIDDSEKKDPFTRTSRALTIDATNQGPFLDGSITFNKTGRVSVKPGHPCTLIDVHYAWYEGTLTANFDAGTISLRGSGMYADTLKYRDG